MTGAWSVLAALTGVAAAAAGGAFLTYSTLTTAGLARLPDAAGMAAMQQMNLAAPRSPAFMALVFGPALPGAVLGVRAVVRWGETGSALTLAGTAVYLVGVVGMTAVFHVPRNDALARTTDPTGWPRWLSEWVLGNHARTVSGLVAGALLVVGARR